MPLYPEVVLDLSIVHDSPVPLASLIGRTVRLMREAGLDDDVIEAYTDEVNFSSFDHALDITRLTVTVKE